MSIDRFFHKSYNLNDYNCAHFVSEVWLFLTGIDIAHKFTGMLQPVKDREITSELVDNFKRLQKPENPCIVLLQGFKNSPHVGIFLNNRVLHIQENGVRYEPIEIAKLGFRSMRFYK